MRLYRVRLELARCRDFPDGSAERGYELTLPLHGDGALDVPACESRPDGCRVQRFWPGEGEEAGHLVHRGDHRWSIRFEDGDGKAEPEPEPESPDDVDDDEEPIFQLDRHRIVNGQYLTIRERDAVERTFRVVRIR